MECVSDLSKSDYLLLCKLKEIKKIRQSIMLEAHFFIFSDDEKDLNITSQLVDLDNKRKQITLVGSWLMHELQAFALYLLLGPDFAFTLQRYDYDITMQSGP